MNFKTASLITRSPWLIHELWATAYYDEFLALRGTENRFRAEETSAVPAAINPQEKFFASDTVKYAPTDSYTEYARNFTGFDGAKVAVICVDGPLMKTDFCGYYGTQSMLSFLKLAENTTSVEQIVLLIDSPGGSVDGTSTFADGVAACAKPVTALIDGLCCSAAYWIASACDEIIATANTNIIGSIGTMIQMVDSSRYQEENGFIVRKYYATESADKNRAFDEALKGDGKLLVKTMLDPINNEFISAVKSNRDGKLGEGILSGHTFIAKEAIKNGLIDTIKTFDAAMQAIEGKTTKSQSSQKKYTMAFEKTLKAADATQFAVVEGGFLLEESHLNKIDSALATAQTNAGLVVSLKDQLAAANTAKTTAETSLATATTEIGTLKTKVATLEKGDGARFSQAQSKGDKGEHVEVVNEFETEIDKQAQALAALNAE